MKLEKICELIKGDLKGDPSIDIKGVSGIKEAKQGDITFLSDKRYIKEIRDCKASAIILNKDLDITIPSIIVENPYFAFAELLEIFYPKKPLPKGIDEKAVIKKNVKMGKDIAIFPHVYVGNNVILGDRVILYAGVFVGDDCRIGDDTVVYPNVSIYENVRIGKNVIIHSGAVIGSDGFGFVKLENGTYHKIPQVGTVCIEDDVEIGANVCIDRANLGETIVKRGTKLDNLIHLAHSVSVGRNTIIASQTGISGSCKIGDQVVLAGQVGVVDHVRIGDHSTVIAQSGITHDIPPKSIQSGSPSMDHGLWRKVHVLLPRLPEFVKNLRELAKRITKIEEDKKKGL